MKQIIFLLCYLPVFLFGQAFYSPTETEQKKAYSQVIAEYIKVMKNDTLKLDTLYIGKHEEFPEIKLPKTIENKTIILLSPNEEVKKPQFNKSFVLINIVLFNFTKDEADFMLVTFHRAYRPQHNCNIVLRYDPTEKGYKLAKQIKFEYAYTK